MTPRAGLLCIAIALGATLGFSAGLVAAEPSLPEGESTRDGQSSSETQDVLFLGPTRPLVLRLRVAIDGKPFRQVWQERFDELFALEDHDRDGRVDFDEAGAVERDMNGGLRDSGASGLKSLFETETIARPALAAHIERTLPPFSVFRRAVIAQGSALALFPLLDTDNDHRLSRAELEAAERQLRQRDFDDDGAITGAELILDPNAIAAADDPASADARLTTDEGSVMGIILGTTTPEQIADKLLKRYDRDRNGRLSTAGAEHEVTLPASLVTRLDHNGDGTLQAEELGAFCDRPADLELDFAMGRAATGQSRSRGRSNSTSAGEFRVRKKLNGGYELKLGEADVDINRNNRDPRQADLVEMRTYDRDGNGYLDLAEASGNNIGKSAFAAMDNDGNGKVFKGELTSFMTRQNAAAAARLQLQVKDLGQDLFSVLDTDMDGVLSARELRSAARVLETDDKNGDGALGGDEVPARVELELVRGVDERTDADTRVARRPTRSASQANTSGPLWYRKMDRNNDGDLSPQEFIGPPSAFQKLDTNGDSLLDREEAEAAGVK
jgi:Ca2+-binding EF-hand superfamily protein